jgi:hypothetical protein
VIRRIGSAAVVIALVLALWAIATLMIVGVA